MTNNQQPNIPAGMKPWNGGYAAPEDIGEACYVMHADGTMNFANKRSILWGRPTAKLNPDRIGEWCGDPSIEAKWIIAYTPRTHPLPTSEDRATREQLLFFLRERDDDLCSDAADYIESLVAEQASLPDISGVGSIVGVWRQAEDNHRRYSDTGDKESDIRFLTLGLTGEAGEVANFVKKRWRDGESHDEAIRLEIADVCAYAFMLASAMGMSPAELIATIAHKQAVFVAKMLAHNTKGAE